jgi:Cyclic-di-AMP receptor
VKLVVAIVPAADAGQTVQALSEVRLAVTRLASSGGFLQQGNARSADQPSSHRCRYDSRGSNPARR